MFYLPGSNDPLNGGIVGEIQEQTDVLHASILLEILHTNKQSVIQQTSWSSGINQMNDPRQ
jgi:hypothetical protein